MKTSDSEGELELPEHTVDVKKEEPMEVKGEWEAEADMKPNFGEFTHGTPTDNEEEADHSLDVEDYQGYPDPLENMGLSSSGFHNNTSPEKTGQEGHWELKNIVGESVEERKPVISVERVEPVPSHYPLQPSALPLPHENLPAPLDVEDTSIAPTMEEAMAETNETIDQISSLSATAPVDEVTVREAASAAEGPLPVPPELDFSVGPNASGVPTEAVNEMPPADMLSVSDKLPGDTNDRSEPHAVATLLVDATVQSDLEILVLPRAEIPMETGERVEASDISAEWHAVPMSKETAPAGNDAAPIRSAVFETVASGENLGSEAIHPPRSEEPLGAFASDGSPRARPPVPGVIDEEVTAASYHERR